jgi:hypothetical protein
VFSPALHNADAEIHYTIYQNYLDTNSYTNLTHTPINTHAHLYTWPGTNPSLQPIVLMAHEDVVPVNPGTLGQWTHPPFEGVVDDEWVWGRGAADCKNQVSTTFGLFSSLDLPMKANQTAFFPFFALCLVSRLDSSWGSCPPWTSSSKKGSNPNVPS